jgi:hypothetical protein
MGAIAKHMPRTILASHDKRFKNGYINKNNIAIGTKINDNTLSWNAEKLRIKAHNKEMQTI